jgi:hypothetical protein
MFIGPALRVRAITSRTIRAGHDMIQITLAQGDRVE